VTAQTKLLTVLIGYEALTVLPTAAMPPFIGHYVDGFGYSLEQAGRIASVEMLGMAAGQAIVLLLFSRSGWNFRRSIFAALILFAIAQVLSTWPQYPRLFTAARFLSGLTGGGMIFATAGLYIASLPRPDRPYAVLYGALFVVGPIGLFSLPYLFDAVGARYVYLALAAAVVLSLPAIRWYPAQRLAAVIDGPSAAAPKPLARLAITGIVLLLASLFMNYLSNGGVWIYLERIGAAMDIHASSRGALLAAGMACGVLGTIAALLCADRLGRFALISVGQLLLVVSYAVLLAGSDGVSFFISVILLNVAVTFYTPFYLAQLSAIDPSGRGATLGMMTFGFGYGLGPAVLSLFLVDGDFTAVIIAASVAVVLSLALLWTVAALPLNPSTIRLEQEVRTP
jgi:MFS family permease